MSSVLRASAGSFLTRATAGRIWNKNVRTASGTSAEKPPPSEGGEMENDPVMTTEEEKHPDAEKEPLPEWPGGVNPETGERDGPRGPEPTRYGDWERKGRVSDF